MARPFKIIDGDGHITETEEQLRRYMPEPFRSSRSHLRAGHDFCLETWDDSADAMFISCMNFDAIAIAGTLEERIGKPVITSHTAKLWRALALAGVDDSVYGVGSLLEGGGTNAGRLRNVRL